MKNQDEILSKHTGYSIAELHQRLTEPILQPYDCSMAMAEYADLVNEAEPSQEKALHKHIAKPRFPKEQLHLKKGSRILNIRGRHIVDKPEILINCMEYWEPTDEDYGSAEEDSATYFPTITEIDEIIKALNEAKAFLNGA